MSTDAIVLLKGDHREIRKLFRAYRPAEDSDTRGRLAERIVQELTVHTYLEDEVMYPAIRSSLPELAQEMEQAHQEHHVADLLCMEITDMDPGDGEFDAKVAVLIEAVTLHIEREEHDWFPQVRAAIGRKSLQEIGERMLTARQTAPVRPQRPGIVERTAEMLGI